MIIEVQQLGLAAFVKMKGGKLIDYKSRKFLFETDTTLLEWEINYLNSCCNKHDVVLIQLRKFLK